MARLSLLRAAMMQGKEDARSIENRRDLQTRIKELEAENEVLQTRLDEISDIVAPVDEDEDDKEEDEDDEEGDESPLRNTEHRGESLPTKSPTGQRGIGLALLI